MKKNYNHLNVPNHWEHYWTRYPQGHTILEALIQWVSQVDDMVDNVNDWNTYLDNFVRQFDTELQNTVIDILKDWQTSGFLDVVISDALQWQLNGYIKTNEQDKLSITAQLQHKVGDGKLATLSDLGQDVKEAMTGGSVAVVGAGTVTYENLANDLNTILQGYAPTNFDSELIDTIYYDYTDGVNHGWDGISLAGYNTLVKNVIPGEKYTITNYVVSDIFAVGQYRTADDVAGPWIGIGAVGQQTDYQTTVPAGMGKIVVTYNREQAMPIIKKIGLYAKSIGEIDSEAKQAAAENVAHFSSNALQYRHSDKTIVVRSRYNTSQDLIFYIAPSGSNKLPQIASFYKESNVGGRLPLDFTITFDGHFIADQTDWVGPYIVKAKNNIDGDLPLSEHFTGGYHGYDNGPSDTVATATNVSFKVFADNTRLSADTEQYTNKIVVEVVNNITATNTKKANGLGRNVLQETVTYTIIGTEIRVAVEIKVLEDVTIQTYYGLQGYVVNFDKFLLVGDNVQPSVFNAGVSKDGGNKDNSDCSMIVAENSMGDKLTLELDRAFGLGNLRHIDLTKPVAFYSEYGKVYFYLISNTNFSANSILNYRGRYVLESNS